MKTTFGPDGNPRHELRQGEANSSTNSTAFARPFLGTWRARRASSLRKGVVVRCDTTCFLSGMTGQTMPDRCIVEGGGFVVGVTGVP